MHIKRSIGIVGLEDLSTQLSHNNKKPSEQSLTIRQQKCTHRIVRSQVDDPDHTSA